MTENVVLAFDGGPASEAALAWTINRTRTAECTLEITTVLEPDISAAFIDYRSAAQKILDDAAAQFRSARPGTTVTTAIRTGNAAHALISASASADLVVIGTNRTSSLTGILHGTLPLRVAGRARCTTVVVPADWQNAGSGIVVGWVDDGTADDAVEFAAREAGRTDQELTVVHSWAVPPAVGLEDVGSARQFDDMERAERDALARVVSDTRRLYPELVVTEHLAAASASVAIVHEARGASLAVVGAHGRGALGGLILGSVSHDVLMNMPTAVAVVPRPDEPIEVLPEILDEYLI
ncbi:MAG: universal stress protein [Rhodoglobus sp.]|nr:universal stress protein [Rhodoglobus sp.]